jgi:hypothetical protein
METNKSINKYSFKASLNRIENRMEIISENEEA